MATSRVSDDLHAVAIRIHFASEEHQIIDVVLEPVASAIGSAGSMAPTIRGEDSAFPSQQRHQTKPSAAVQKPSMYEHRRRAMALLAIRKQRAVSRCCRFHISSNLVRTLHGARRTERGRRLSAWGRWPRCRLKGARVAMPHSSSGQESVRSQREVPRPDARRVVSGIGDRGCCADNADLAQSPSSQDA